MKYVRRARRRGRPPPVQFEASDEREAEEEEFVPTLMFLAVVAILVALLLQVIPSNWLSVFKSKSP